MATSDGDLPDRVAELARPLAAARGVDLVDVEVKGQRGRRLVRLVGDSDNGLDVDTIAHLSRDLARALDDRDLVPGSYTLEVTSPGTDRPLRSPRDLRRNLGRDVRLVTVAEDERREVTGVLVDVDDHAVSLRVDGDVVRVGLADVDHAKVALPW